MNHKSFSTNIGFLKHSLCASCYEDSGWGQELCSACLFSSSRTNAFSKPCQRASLLITYVHIQWWPNVRMGNPRRVFVNIFPKLNLQKQWQQPGPHNPGEWRKVLFRGRTKPVITWLTPYFTRANIFGAFNSIHLHDIRSRIIWRPTYLQFGQSLSSTKTARKGVGRRCRTIVVSKIQRPYQSKCCMHTWTAQGLCREFF